MSPFSVKITVQKCIDPTIVFNNNIPIRPGTGKPYTKCPVFKEGQEFIVSVDDKRPDGFCWWAWKDLRRDILVLAMGGNFYPGDWIEEGRQYSCCTDGVRPVSFKLERLQE